MQSKSLLFNFWAFLKIAVSVAWEPRFVMTKGSVPWLYHKTYNTSLTTQQLAQGFRQLCSPMLARLFALIACQHNDIRLKKTQAFQQNIL